MTNQVTSPATRLSAESKAFVAFMARYCKGASFSFVIQEAVRVAHNGDYAEVPRSFEMPAYSIGWAYETGRINGVTSIALRSMDVRNVLKLVARVHDQGLVGNDVAAFLMRQDFQVTAK